MSDPFPETVETDRLRLECLSHENVDTLELYDAFADGVAADEVFEHIPQEPYETPKEARDRIERAEERWREGTAAEYVVRAEAGEIAGTAHLHCDWERRTARLGFVLRKPFWGRGYSGERAAAFFELAFDRLDLDGVVTGCNAGNEKSRRAIEKYVERAGGHASEASVTSKDPRCGSCGGRYEGRLRNRVPMDDRIDDLHRYTVTREEWTRNR